MRQAGETLLRFVDENVQEVDLDMDTQERGLQRQRKTERERGQGSAIRGAGSRSPRRLPHNNLHNIRVRNQQQRQQQQRGAGAVATNDINDSVSHTLSQNIFTLAGRAALAASALCFIRLSVAVALSVFFFAFLSLARICLALHNTPHTKFLIHFRFTFIIRVVRSACCVLRTAEVAHKVFDAAAHRPTPTTIDDPTPTVAAAAVSSSLCVCVRVCVFFCLLPALLFTELPTKHTRRVAKHPPGFQRQPSLAKFVKRLQKIRSYAAQQRTRPEVVGAEPERVRASERARASESSTSESSRKLRVGCPSSCCSTKQTWPLDSSFACARAVCECE